ncbi:hypothetical protein DPEC_G00326440 [Dallia pectoralis]|uniref:Uncharacterized protein n=1 Tax=Dallia pectoralis TaxID=75939 RepID=A0ACC2F7U6_DALPE|nr:hypothetical protein DPEC_G00326440 [Dallia pectoralis]
MNAFMLLLEWQPEWQLTSDRGGGRDYHQCLRNPASLRTTERLLKPGWVSAPQTGRGVDQQVSFCGLGVLFCLPRDWLDCIQCRVRQVLVRQAAGSSVTAPDQAGSAVLVSMERTLALCLTDLYCVTLSDVGYSGRTERKLE